MKAVKDYKECLKTDPYLSFKTYCRDNSINYKKILDWMQRHGIYMRQLQDEARGEDLANGNLSANLYPVMATKPPGYGEQCSQRCQHYLSKQYQSDLAGMYVGKPDFVIVIVSS
jgi:hypothetical protein